MDVYGHVFGYPSPVRVLRWETNVVKTTVTSTLYHDDDDGEDYYNHYYEQHLSRSRSEATPCKRKAIPDATPCKRKPSCEVSPIFSFFAVRFRT